VKKVLFVCSGNTCRSPMAKGIFSRYMGQNQGGSLGNQYEACSAGLFALDGLPASPEAVEVMLEFEIDLSQHRARRVDEYLVEEADLILVMTREHYRYILDSFQGSRGKTFILSEWAGYHGQEIPDPYGMDKEGYRKCARKIEQVLKKALKNLRE